MPLFRLLKWNSACVRLGVWALVFSGFSANFSVSAAEPDDAFGDLARRIELLEQDNQSLRSDLSQLRQIPPVMPPAPGTVVFPPDDGLGPESPVWADIVAPPAVAPAPVPAPVDPLNCAPAASAAASKYPTVKVTGFFQADLLWAQQDSENQAAIVAGAPLGDIQDGADFRRTRLAATGDVFDNAGYMIEMDFAFPGRPSFMDVYLDVRELGPLGTLRVGQWRQPFGLDALESVRELMFLERALPFCFNPFRQIGSGFSNHYDDLGITWATSVYRYPTDPFGSNVGDDGGYGFASRTTWLAWEGDHNGTLHLGGGYVFADPANDIIRFRNTPELFVGETAGSLAPVGVPTNMPAFVDTNDMPSNHFSLFGAELAGTYGSWSAQSELMVTTVDRIAAESVTFWGAYAQVAYVLTGEHHPYNKTTGVYTRVTPTEPFTHCGGCGAWELAARWSTIDLNDADIAGNELQNLTFGLNWYLNKNMKFQFNYIHAMLDTIPTGSSVADLYALRAQVDF